MIPSNPYSKGDPYGCRADYEYDQILEARRLAHIDGECHAPCDYCEAEAADKEREDKDDGEE